MFYGLKFEPVITGISKSISASTAMDNVFKLLSNQHNMKSAVDVIQVKSLSSALRFHTYEISKQFQIQTIIQKHLEFLVN